ncbi:Sec1-binding region of Mso1-domain-containing protein [Xylariaceae sp. FL0804]|nr:Sec1-binding region of Mso1-domain-containing protein [Xylariaceae sp. FL0804]
MSNWYSNLVSTTTSRITNLQRTILGGEADGDTEDDTHACRVLRSYYAEKGRPLPGWLPPDPKAPPPVAAVYAQPAVGARYGAAPPQQQPAASGSLSSLWDNNGNAGGSQGEPQSLRRGARGGGPAALRSDARNSPFRNSDPMGGGGREDVAARPLPSQRAGSYQTAASFGSAGGGGSIPAGAAGGGGGGGSAQDRLKQRLFGGSRTTSPAASGPFSPPPQGGGGGGGGGGASGGLDYEDRFAPGGMYDGSRGGGGGGGGGGGRRPGGLPSGPRMR